MKATRPSSSRRARRHHTTPQRPPAGSPPGLLRPPEDARPTSIRIFSYNAKTVSEKSLTQVSEIGTAKDRVVWVDVVGQRDVSIFQGLIDHFSLHPLLMEDALSIHQRPKLETVGDHLFLVVRMPGGSPVEFEQVGIFIGPSFVITIQEHEGDCLDPVRQRLRDNIGRIRKSGPDYLAYAIVDTIIDNYYPMVLTLEEKLDHMELRVLDGQGLPVRAAHAIRGELTTVRRYLLNTRDALMALQREESHVVTPSTQPFFRDAVDHIMQLLYNVESAREMYRSIWDLHQTHMQNRMNEIMKVLTLIATIFIPLSFIAGLYGMNFVTEKSAWNMPELKWTYGYPFALGLMVSTAGLMIWYFRRKGWLFESVEESPSPAENTPQTAPAVPPKETTHDGDTA